MPVRTKKLNLFFACCVLSIFCHAQVYEEAPEPEPKPSQQKANKARTNPSVPMLTLQVQGNHDFYLVVGKQQYEKTPKNTPKQIKLSPGVHKLVFEEADSTGERIEHYFRVTKEMTRLRDTLYKVNFKEDFLQIMQSDSTAAGKRLHQLPR